MRFVALLILLAAGSAHSAEPVVSFKRDIQPIFERHCTDCHSGWFPDARLDLSNLEDIRKGGKSGPLLVPGNPNKGWLMHVLTKASGRLRMPPQGGPLSAEDIKQIRQWIAGGAK